MPGYKIHLAGGVAIVALIFKYDPTHWLTNTTLSQKAFYLLALLLGTLFPDIDIKSQGQKIFSKVLFIFFIIACFKREFNLIVVTAILALFPLLVKHRGITHNPWFLITLLVALCYFANMQHLYSKPLLLHGAFFFIAGAFSHLILDFGLLQLFTRKK